MSTITLAMVLATAGPTYKDGDPEALQETAQSEQPAVILNIPPPPAEPVPGPAGGLPATLRPTASVAGSEEGVIVVSANPRDARTDPLADINAATYDVVTVVDDAVLGPVAGTYEKVVPAPIRSGIRNVLLNLVEPVVFVNYLLQFKPGKALETLGRFGINSTLGVGGLFDMAKRKPFHLPYRRNGFANTLAYHGVSTGAYLFLPVVGPTTVRDMIGRVLDVSLVPTVMGTPFNTTPYAVGTGVAKGLTDRVAFDEQIRANRAQADPYLATRDFYLQRRQAEVDALHSPEYRARTGIPAPVAPTAIPPVDRDAGSGEVRPAAYVPGATGMAPAPYAKPPTMPPAASVPAATPGLVGDARRP